MPLPHPHNTAAHSSDSSADQIVSFPHPRTDTVASSSKRSANGTVGWARTIKQRSDERFGNASRLAQFCAVGFSGMIIDLSCYAVFRAALETTWLGNRPSNLLGLGLPTSVVVARALAILVALIWNFTLNRRVTFNDAPKTGLIRQFAAYALGNALAIAVSFGCSVALPARIPFFQDRLQLAAVVGIVVSTSISFSTSRWLVFRKTPSLPSHSP